MSSQKMVDQSRRLSVVLAKYVPGFFADRLKKPIFVIGCGRSGTTLLAELLGSHPDVAHWSEANQIWDSTWYPWQPSNQGMWPLEFDPVAFTDRWWRDTEQCQTKVKAVFGAHLWMRHKSHFLNKSPFNTFRIPYLLKMFPEPVFVHLVRDGRAVAYSYARRLSEKNKLREWPEPQQTTFRNSFGELVVWLASFWKANLEEVTQQDEALGLSKVGVLLEVTYEELCADTPAVLSRVCRHVGLDPDRLILTVEQTGMRSQNHKWQQNLESDVIDRMIAAMNPVLTQRGYV